MTFRPSSLLLTLLLVGACDGSNGTREVTPPTTGTLRLTTTTSGPDPDADGYTLFMDAIPSLPIASNDTLDVDVPPGRYLALLTGIADNCRLAVPDTVEVFAGQVVPVALPVGCTPALTDLRVAVQTTGEDLDPSGYVVTVDSQLTLPVPSNGVVDIRAPNGVRSIGLGDRGSNCTITGGPGGGVSLPRGQVTEVQFAVQCVRTQKIAFTYNGGTYTINLDSTGWSRIGPGIFPRWSPDGRQLLSTYQAFPVIMNADGSGVHPVTLSVGSGTFDGATWSPDGSRFAVSVMSVARDNANLFVFDTSGANPVRLTSATAFDRSPDWSPSGDRVVFNRDGTGGLWIVNADGSGITQLTSRPSDRAPRWSPDGTRILFLTIDSTGVDWEAVLINPDGTNRTRLAILQGEGDNPIVGWADGGASVVAYTGRRVYTISVQTGAQSPSIPISALPQFDWRN